MPRQKTSSVSLDTGEHFTVGTQVIKPPLQFDDKLQSLAQILQQYNLPRVVKCAQSPCSLEEMGVFNLDLTKPFLAYCKRSIRKVSSHNVEFDPARREFVEVGNDILIPQDYVGWFAVVGSPDHVFTDPPIPYHSTLARLAATQCRSFLVGGKEPIQALMISSNEGGQVKKFTFPVLPGTVLRKGGLYTEQKTSKKKKQKDSVPRTFLMCTDEQERDMLIYTHQSGMFYVISQDGAPIRPPVLQMKDIIQRHQFPVIVKLLHGRVPATPCAFTGTLVLTDSGNCQTVVASTFLNYRNVNFEIPIATQLKFQVAQETPGLLGSKIYINTLSVCNEKTPAYIKNMKVVFGDTGVKDNRDDEKSREKQSDSNKKNGQEGTNSQKSITSSPRLAGQALRKVVKPQPELRDTDLTSGPGADAGASATAGLRTPRCSASIMSQKSQLSRMSVRLTVNEDSPGVFVPMTPKTSPSLKLAEKQQPVRRKSSKILHDDTPKAPESLVKSVVYDPPKPDTLPIKSNAPKKDEKTMSDKAVSRPPAIHSRCKPADARNETPTLPKSQVPGAQSAPSFSEMSPVKDQLMPLWTNNDGSASITIQGVPGQPVSSGQLGEGGSEDPGYLMRIQHKGRPYDTVDDNAGACSTFKSPPKVAPKPLRTEITQGLTQVFDISQSSPQLPSIPPLCDSPPLPKRRQEGKSLSERALGEDSANSPSDCIQKREGVYANIDFLQLFRIGDDDSVSSSYSVRSSDHYDNLLQELGQNFKRFSVSTSDGYIQPIHKEYSGGSLNRDDSLSHEQSVENQQHMYDIPQDVAPYPEGSSGGNHYSYISLINDPSRTDSGVFDADFEIPNKDENHNVTKLGNQNTVPEVPPVALGSTKNDGSAAATLTEQPQSSGRVNTSKNTTKQTIKSLPSSGHRPNQIIIPEAPPLPKRPKESFGQVVLKQISHSSDVTLKPSFGPKNKEFLIKEVKKTGVQPTTELALRGLNAADIATLCAKEEHFDDDLIALLPRVGEIDLRKIALCLKTMNLHT